MEPACRAAGNRIRYILLLILSTPLFLSTLLFLCTLLLPGMVAAAQLSASVDRKNIALEETLTLSVRFDEQVASGEPDFSALRADFDILGNRRANQYRSINGQVESFTQWVLTLAPRRAGQLSIPALEFRGERSIAIAITVTDNPAPAQASSDRPVFLETSLSREQVYVQQQVLLTFRLFTSVDLAGLNSEDLQLDNALLKQLSENRFQKIIDGRRFGVVELTYAIFPQQSGSLDIPSILWNVTTQAQGRSNFGFDPFLRNSGKRLRLRSDALSVDVLPSPDSYTGNHWLPARDLQIQQSWSRDPQQFRVGEPITRKLQIDVDGLMAAQIPPLQKIPVDGIRYYPDQPQSGEALEADGIHSSVNESYAIVPSRAGKFTLPEIVLDWWDTEQQIQRQALLPQQTITVLPAASAATGNSAPAAPGMLPGESSSATDIAQTTGGGLDATATVTGSGWIYSTLLFAASSVWFALLWWRARSAATPTAATEGGDRRMQASEKVAWQKLQQALRDGDCQRIRSLLMRWAEVRLAPQRVHSLDQLATRWPQLGTELDSLQRALFAEGATNFDCAKLKQHLDALRRRPRKQKSTAETALPPLYPTQS